MNRQIPNYHTWADNSVSEWEMLNQGVYLSLRERSMLVASLSVNLQRAFEQGYYLSKLEQELQHD